MELMITVAIVGILASIAYPSYTNSILRSHRTDARVELLKTAQLFEKCFTQYAAYNNFTSCAAATPYQAGATQTIPNGRYQISAAFATATSYTITATAKAGQASDTTCATLTLTETNIRSPVACW